MPFIKKVMMVLITAFFVVLAHAASAETENKIDPAKLAAPAAPVTSKENTPAKTDPKPEPNVDNKKRLIIDGHVMPDYGDEFILNVGETKPIHAARAVACKDKQAPSFEVVQKNINTSKIVKFSDGGIKDRESKSCNGVVPARMILATGIKPGTEKIVVYGAVVTIIVK